MNRSCKDRVAIRLMDLHPKCLDLAVSVFGYVIPVLALLVTAVNILTVIVFLKPHVRSHTTMILSFIACADAAGIVCPAVVFAYHYMFGFYKEFLTCRQTKYVYIFGDICVDMFNMLSLWLTVLLAFIRCKCITSPVISKSIHSARRIVIYVTCILILVCLVHVPSFFVFDFQSVTVLDTSTNTTATVCGVLETDGIFLKSCSRRKVHVLMETLLDSIVPCVFLLYFNFSMLLTLREAKQSRSSLRRNISSKNVCSGDGSLEIQICSVKPKGISHYEMEEIDVHQEEMSVNITNRQFATHEGNMPNKRHFIAPKAKGNQKQIFLPCANFFPKKNLFDTNESGYSPSSDSVLDRLDKESRRISWLILIVSTIVVVHEIPIAIANTYALASYTNKPLPLTINGCYSVIQTLWQFITYPIIFLIYSCMSRVFRLELLKSLCLISACKYDYPILSDRGKGKSFLSPCSVRKLTSEEKQTVAGPSENEHSDMVNTSNTQGKILHFEFSNED